MILAGAGLISDTLERTGAEVKQPIIYHFDSGPAVSSPTLAEWHVQRWREYARLIEDSLSFHQSSRLCFAMRFVCLGKWLASSFESHIFHRQIVRKRRALIYQLDPQAVLLQIKL